MNALLLAVAVVAADPAKTETPTNPGPYELEFDQKTDLIVTGSAAAVWVSTETFLKGALTPSRCRWCDRDPETGRSTVSRFDASGRTLQWRLADQKKADTLSNVVGFGLLPLSTLGMNAFLAHDAGKLRENAATDALIVVEAVTFAVLVNQIAKFWIGRERPFVHALPEGEKPFTEHPHDNNLSFFSGHTTFSFALLTSAATVADLRGYKNAWLIWVVGLPFAVAAPYLRMAADRHYLSDILVGGAVGSLFGIAIPKLFHARIETPDVDLQFAPAPGGVGVIGAF